MLLGQPGCHLCHEMRETIRPVLEALGLGLEERDVRDDPDLERGRAASHRIGPPQGPPVPLPAELEFIARRGGKWVTTRMTDPESNVFHKALGYTTPSGESA